MVDMKGSITETRHFVALLLVGCFGVVAAACCVQLTASSGVMSGSDHCDGLSSCLMSRLGYGAVNEFVLVSILGLMAVSVVFVLWHKGKELQKNFFKCWWRFWRAESLCWQDYLIGHFSRGVVRSKIYG